MFSCEFCEIFKNTFFKDRLRATASNTSSRMLLSDFVWSFEFSLRQRNTLDKYTPNNGMKIKICTCLPVWGNDFEGSCFPFNVELNILYQQLLIFLGFINTFLFKKNKLKSNHRLYKTDLPYTMK